MVQPSLILHLQSSIKTKEKWFNHVTHDRFGGSHGFTSLQPEILLSSML